MVQTGFTKRIRDRGFEDYVSMKKHLVHRQGGAKIEEAIFHHQQVSPTSATPAELLGNGTLSNALSYIGKTEIAIKTIGADAEKAADNGKIITLVYLDNDGVSHTCTATITATFHDTAMAFTPAIADFYCPVSLSISAASASDLTIITSGGADVWGTITAAATAATDAQLIGVGQVYGQEVGAANANAGTILELRYYTPWGEEKEGYCTLNANSDLAGQKFYHTVGTTTESVKDYYRTITFESSAVAVDELEFGNLAVSATYGGINIGNYEEIHGMQFAPAASEGTLYVGDIHICNAIKDYPATVWVYFQPKDCVVQELLKWTLNGGADITIDLGFELEPLSEFMIKISDDAAHPVTVGITSRNILLLP